MVVDEASEVLYIDDEEIEPASDIIAERNNKLVYGIGKTKDRIIILLDLSELIAINTEIIKNI